MPTYLYKCPQCNHKWEDYSSYEDRNNVPCPKCTTIGSIDWAGFKDCFVEKFKYLRTGAGRIDEGIPFGEVPGDEEYMGKDLDDPDYLGPLP